MASAFGISPMIAAYNAILYKTTKFGKKRFVKIHEMSELNARDHYVFIPEQCRQE